jgi:hypothetical protein
VRENQELTPLAIENLYWENIRPEIKSSGFKRKGTSLVTAMNERQAKEQKYCSDRSFTRQRK